MQSPPQTPKVDPTLGVAVNVTVVLGAKPALQVVEQAIIPGGLLSMVPCPVPLLITVSVKSTDAAVKVAVTV